MGKRKSLKALVVGSGWGRNHAAGFQAAEGVELRAICGRTRSPRNVTLAEQMGVPLCTDLDEALREVRPDLVSVATQEPQHAEVTLKALAAGAHVYCEKVMADRIAAAEDMLGAARRAKRQLMIGYNYRFSPSAVKVREWLDARAVGEPLYATAFTFGFCLHHCTDLVLSLLGKPVCVFGQVDTRKRRSGTRMDLVGFDEFMYSAATVKAYMIRFESGAVANFVSSDYTSALEPGVRLAIGGTKGRILMDDIVGDVRLYNGTRESRHFSPSQIADKLDLNSCGQAAVVAFCEAVRQGLPVPIPGEDGVAMMRLEKAIVDSARAGKPVDL